MADRRDFKAKDRPRFVQQAVSWFHQNARDLPWRHAEHATDPYARMVSEAMLQQTRVATVTDRFAAWLARWPDSQSLASEPEEAAVAAWKGLGYYARARRLHQAACRVAADGWPDDFQGLLKLPGLGLYSAAAVASMAFGEPVPAVDGNVARLAIRYWGLEADAADPRARSRVAERLKALIPADYPGAFNEALIELGATICVPHNPLCHSCPLRDHCVSHATGRQNELPLRPVRRRPRKETIVAHLVTDGDCILLHRRGQGILEGAWGLPMEHASKAARTTTPIAALTHTFTHRHWDIYIVHSTEPPDHASTDAEWVTFAQATQRIHTKLDEKVLAAASAAVK